VSAWSRTSRRVTGGGRHRVLVERRWRLGQLQAQMPDVDKASHEIQQTYLQTDQSGPLGHRSRKSNSDAGGEGGHTA